MIKKVNEICLKSVCKYSTFYRLLLLLIEINRQLA